jgi:dTDP-4-amino-4,6-dideoxygalactose transaminase
MNMKNATVSVPLLDLAAQHKPIRAEIDAAIRAVIDSQHFINGPEVVALEAEVAAYCQARHCIGVSSGSDALLIALMALDVAPGDEVITTPYTFFATAGAIARIGAKPVFVDIDPRTFNLDVSQVEAKVTGKTRVLLPVHLFGQCAEMQPLLEVARRHRLAIIEDAAQAIGAEYQGKRAGSLGDIGCYSFFPSKNLGAFGDGGAVVTSNDALAEKLLLLRNHGARPKYYHKIVGGNFRLDTLQAAVLRVKLRYLDRWTALRQQHAAFYEAALSSLPHLHGQVTTPAVVQSRHIFNQYVVRVAKRDALRDHLKQARVGTEVYYPVPMHLQECFANLGHRVGEFPESERAALTTLALPVYPELTASALEYVVEAVSGFYQRAVAAA